LNKLYCVNSNNSQNIYFTVFQTNSVLYKAQIDVYFMPSATNALLYGYQKPEGVLWNFPASNTMNQITINQNLNHILVFQHKQHLELLLQRKI
jgi:hypothetical protein